ncbi:indole-3-glycerol phosphate synthase [Desulfosarcina sp. BuS5]|uniref:indole-3-glycerol phosphate synthase TrpC n=1 Tax=Desulfosarcina sp. BuS5 TaxID=933262 RepID=UPI00048403E4|nr:indole-3-glycerol phosphate synthase TrpC [Desulfosarcina sp. BuS5]WDN90188.1 indole-3-glycerol phosphate synthase [Desulfosarcina sp. BuS5]
MTSNFLNIIVNNKQEEIKSIKKIVPEETARVKALSRSGAPREKRSFFNNLAQPGPAGINIIAEIKRASPSKGLIAPDLNPVDLAKEYEQGGAAAISVLTEKNYFKGSLDDLIRARESTNLPVLRKDFIISSYQIYESAAIGADAVLLIVRILSGEQLKDYLSLCRELGLDALVEIHSEKDLENASVSGARLIGINNRNLSSFETDLSIAVRLVSMLAPGQIPIAASGIKDRIDIEKNLEAGINNFLIGESLVRAKKASDFIKSLLWTNDYRE